MISQTAVPTCESWWGFKTSWPNSTPLLQELGIRLWWQALQMCQKRGHSWSKLLISTPQTPPSPGIFTSRRLGHRLVSVKKEKNKKVTFAFWFSSFIICLVLNSNLACNLCLQFLLAFFACNFCLQFLLAIFACNFCLQFLLAISACNFCLQFLLVNFTSFWRFWKKNPKFSEMFNFFEIMWFFHFFKIFLF